MFNNRSPKDAAWKTEFFAYIISWKGRAASEKNSEQRFSGKTKPTCKYTAIFEHSQIGGKI